MPELEDEAVLFRQDFEKARKPLAVGMHLRRKLEQAGPEARPEPAHAGHDHIDALFAVLQPLEMRDVARGLPREAEACGRGLAPILHRLRRGQPVERIIDLCAVEPRRIEGQLILDPHLFGVKRPAPAAVMPAGCADPDIFRQSGRRAKILPLRYRSPLTLRHELTQ
jgi:hypothetical protein